MGLSLKKPVGIFAKSLSQGCFIGFMQGDSGQHLQVSCVFGPPSCGAIAKCLPGVSNGLEAPARSACRFLVAVPPLRSTDHRESHLQGLEGSCALRVALCP